MAILCSTGDSQSTLSGEIAAARGAGDAQPRPRTPIEPMTELSSLANAIRDGRGPESGRYERFHDALIHSISHELRMPLSMIMASATELQGSIGAGADRDVAGAVATIRHSAEELNSFIDNLFDLFKLYLGHPKPSLELAELADVVNSAVAKARTRLYGRRFVVTMPPALPMCRLDLFLMERVVLNLLDNAAKYSQPGTTISVTASRRASEVWLEVSDQGAGIAERDLRRVFEPYYRGAEHLAATVGTGLGLSICDAFVQAHGGIIEASSDGIGRGATFRVRLPIPMMASL